MDKQAVKETVQLSVIEHLARQGEYYVPVTVSARHAHLSAEDVETLFGRGHKLTAMRALSQPGQFACEEQVTLVGPKRQIERVRVLGPPRSKTQVEISVTDCYTLGIEPVIRMSGNLEGSAGAKLVGPVGEVALPSGIIVAARHLHANPEQAAWFGIKDGDIIRVKAEGVRETTFANIAVRINENYDLELHLDVDEANAAGLKSGDLFKLVKE